MKRTLVLVVLSTTALLPARADAQPDRFEVGQRLRAFEIAWEGQKEEAARKRALAAMEKVTPLFFKGLLDEAARLLDQARHALTAAPEAPADVRWADALHFRPAMRFADTALPELPVALAPFYKVEAKAPKDAALELTLRGHDGKVLASARTALAALPLEAKLSLRDVRVPVGDHALEVKVFAGKKLLAAPPGQVVSFAGQLAGRVAALRKAVANLPAKPAVERATLRELTGLLEALAERRTGETSFPAARLLNEAETVAKAARAGKSHYGDRKTGQFWLRLPVGDKSVAVRLLAPDAVARGKPLPLVVALHGAGGGENLFFEGYGQGEIVRQCRARGWLLVAPRTAGFSFKAPVAELVDEIDRLYPVDRKRVFLVGHSMGAIQAVSAAQETPERFAAVAALGGGGFVKKSDALKALPFFVGVGTRDIAPGLARTLKDGLTRAGVATVVFREYADVEHIVVVRVALPEVFAFFDKIARR